MRVILVHNQDAGACRPSAKKLLTLLQDAGLSPTYCSAKDKSLSDVLRQPTDMVIAAGGDGTVTRVATQLPDREIPIVILPLGTANNTARAFGISGTVEEIIDGWRDMDERRLDVCVAEGPWGERRFIEAVGIGALADATSQKIRGEESMAKRIERGRDAFRKAVAKAEPIKVDVTVDDRRIKGNMLLVEIMNIGFVGSNLRLAPLAKPGDRQFDVAFVPIDKRDAFLTWLEHPEVEDAPVVVETGQTVSVAKNSAPIRVGDKTATPAEGKVHVKIEELQQAILVPKPHHAAETETSEKP